MKSTRTSAAPAAGLLAMLLAAAVLAWGGWQWAARHEVRRTPTDPAALTDFSNALDGELHRLAAVYEEDLADIELAFNADSGAGALSMVKPVAEGLAGLKQVSVLTPGSGARPEHLNVSGRMQSLWPEPILLARSAVLPPQANAVPIVLEEAFPPQRRASTDARRGWTKSAGGKWLVHWRTVGPQRVLAEVIDQAELREAIRRHLIAWSDTAVGPLDASRASVELRQDDGAAIFSRRVEKDRAPDFLQPLTTALGTWRLGAWDTVKEAQWRDPARLTGAWTLAGMFVLGGTMVFRHQRRALRQAEERVSFVNRVSHELRTPVTNMLLNLDLARDHLGPSANGAAARLDVVTEEVQRLGRLVDNVLSFSRRDRPASPGKATPCVPDEIIATVLAQFAPSLARRGFQVSHAHGASLPIVLESDAFSQIMANLISNAEKYAADGHFLGIESRIADRLLTVKVTDRGPGIPAEAAERIFLPFERLSDRTNDGVTGTGLGLCIARDLAGRLGGQLRLIASPQGAVFELIVPATAERTLPS